MTVPNAHTRLEGARRRRDGLLLGTTGRASPADVCHAVIANRSRGSSAWSNVAK